jgi:hypothetical protein
MLPHLITTTNIHSMAEEVKALPVKKVSKKETQKEIFVKLSGALAEYKAPLGDKKFETKVKKASKLFAVDIARAFNRKSKESKQKLKVAKKK